MDTTQQGTEEGLREPVRRAWMPKLFITGAVVAAAAGVANFAGVVSGVHDQPSRPPAVICHGAAPPMLRYAAIRAGIPESEWGNLRGETIAGVYVSVNGRKVPLNKREKDRIREEGHLPDNFDY